MLSKHMFIDGRWVASAGSAAIDVVNPVDGSMLGRVPRAGLADVDLAVRAARQAFDAGPWPGLDPRERARLLFRLAAGIRERAEELAHVETQNSGKPLADARAEVEEVAATFDYYAGWVTKLSGDIPPVSGGALSLVVREPVGVCGLITAWNYPLVLAAWKIAPALAAGCTVVVKPAEQTPLTTLLLAEIAAAAGLPAGVLNVITGFGPEAGAPLVEHPLVDKISFTGSRDVGTDVMRRAAGTLKRVTLELGGKSPNIVFADAPFARAVAGTCAGIFGNQGEICSAGSRVLVERRIYDDAVEAFVENARRIRVGNGLDPGVSMGPLVSRAQQERVMGYIATGHREGAKLAFGGETPRELAASGYFVAPTIFVDVDPGMRIAREEIFGPVMAVIPFDGPEEAVQLANRTEYGLAAAIWTADTAKGLRVARSIRAGTVWINDTQVSSLEAVWGGFKQSGIGRELGRYALDAYLEYKQIYINLQDAK